MGFLEWQRKSDECGMDRMEPINPIQDDSKREPWKCDHCHKMIHNTDKDGYPAPGAPQSKWGSPEYPNVCTLCFRLRTVIEGSTYLRAASDNWKSRQKNNDKLKPGENYFRP